jgi:hypothetical protein
MVRRGEADGEAAHDERDREPPPTAVDRHREPDADDADGARPDER